MKKVLKRTGVLAACFAVTVVITYAITNLFFSQTRTTELSKKIIFQFDLDIRTCSGEVGPGDSFSVNPVIFNDATKEMYVFVEIQMPESEGPPLYTYKVGDGWTPVEQTGEKTVYAYGDAAMTILPPGESTNSLTKQMRMRSISNAEYASIDDINVKITGYAIGIDNVDSAVLEAWNTCKQIGNLD